MTTTTTKTVNERIKDARMWMDGARDADEERRHEQADRSRCLAARALLEAAALLCPDRAAAIHALLAL